MLHNNIAINDDFCYANVMNKNNLKDFYTIKEFSQKIRKHPNTIYSSIKSGVINAFRIGVGKTASYRIPHSEINRMAEVNMNDVIEKIIQERMN